METPDLRRAAAGLLTVVTVLALDTVPAAGDRNSSTRWSSAVAAAPWPRAGIAEVALVNDVTHRPILGLSPLTDGAVVDLTRLVNRNVSLRATPAAGTAPASVTFRLTGATGTTYSRTETAAPFFLCDDYVDCPLLVTPDDYTLTVRASTGAVFTVRFTVSANAVAPPSLDVLYVGNSLIGTATGASGEDTPALIGRLASTAGRTVRTTKVIHFGNTLQQTWDAGEVAAAVNGTARYDYVVLQEYSTLVATNPAQARSTLLNTYAQVLARVLKPGGKVVLFKNWALTDPAPFPTRAAATAAIDSGYAGLSGALPATNLVAPIGDTFETVIAMKGTAYLIVADGKHPDDTAIYLDAATLYGIFFHESPKILGNLYLPAATASAMRDVAAAAIGY